MIKVFYGFYVRNDKDEVVHNEYGYKSMSDLNDAIAISAVEGKGAINKYLYHNKKDPQVGYVFEGPDED